MRRTLVYGLQLGLALVLAVGAPACRKKQPLPPAPAAGEDAEKRAAMRFPGTDGDGHKRVPGTPGLHDGAEPPPLRRCFPGDSSGAPPRALDALLDRAAELYDKSDFSESLACAEEASRVEPRSVEAHHDRAAALEELGRWQEAIDAFTRALALDPDDPETLAGAADLYVNRLPPSTHQAAEHTEIGLELARRGTDRLRRRAARKGARPSPKATEAHKALAARLALLEGQALNDLGRSREALARLDAALAAAPDDLNARYERAVALFDLCRFADARRGFSEVLDKSPEDAWAHYHLGLTLEQLGDSPGAARELTAAQTRAPKDFRAPIELPPTEFRAIVDAEVKKLPAALRADLGTVKLETADLPDVRDLTAEEPPLAPTILGLFRGAPLGEPSSEPRTIILYRKNLARAVASRDELVTQVRTTLYHELGHLRGEDDEALRARGLE